MRLNGLPALPGAVPMKIANSTFSRSGGVWHLLEVAEYRAEPERQAPPQYEPWRTKLIEP